MQKNAVILILITNVLKYVALRALKWVLAIKTFSENKFKAQNKARLIIEL